MTVYSAETLDLSRLAAPSLVDTNFETVRASQIAEFLRVWTLARQLDSSLPVYDVQMLETDLPVVEAESFSYGIMKFCQQVNDAADALRLAKAVGADLEHLTATYHHTERQTTIPANPNTGSAAVLETDDELRSRSQLAPEALADMGLTPGGYMYLVRTAFASAVKDVRPIRRGGGMIELRLLGRLEPGPLVATRNPDGSTTYVVDGRVSDGSVPETVVGDVIGAFNPENASQSTDILSVFSANVTPYDVDLTLVMPSGPDPEAVKTAAAPYIQALGDSLHRIKSDVFREALSSAAHVGPVSTVRVNSPSSDIPSAPGSAPFMRKFTLRTQVLT